MFFALASLTRTASGNELGYDAFIHSDKRIKCMYGYFAHKTGDHLSAIRIFEDCIRRWNDVYSMIGLAHIYENGVGIPVDLEKAAALMKRGAEMNDVAGYSSLARYHYGVALYEGRGVSRDIDASRHWLQTAADEGIADALTYLKELESYSKLSFE